MAKKDTETKSKPKNAHTRKDGKEDDRLDEGFFTKKQNGAFIHQPVLMAFKDEDESDAVERLAKMGWNIVKGNYSYNKSTRKFTVKK